MSTQIGDISSGGGLVTFTEAAPGQTPLVTLTDNGDGTLSIALADQPQPVAQPGHVTVQLGPLVLTDDDGAGTRWITSVWPAPGSPATSVQYTQKLTQPGAWAGITQLTERSVPINGFVQTGSASLLRAAADALNDACSLGLTPLLVTVDGDTRWLLVRQQGEVLFEPQSDRVAAWSIQVAADDPRWFADALSDSTGLPSATGGFTFPITFPLVINETVLSGTVSLTNPGNMSGPVVARVDGPCTGPIITHVGSGRRLVLATDLVLGVGEFITVDMENELVLAQGQSPRGGWVTERGFSAFDPGVNEWLFTSQGSYNPDARMQVVAWPSWK